MAPWETLLLLPLLLGAQEQCFFRYEGEQLQHAIGNVNFERGMLFDTAALAVQYAWHPIGWLPIFGTCAAGWLVFAGAAWLWGIPHADRPRWSRMFSGLVRPAAGEAKS